MWFVVYLFFFIEDVGFSVGQLQFSIAQRPAEQTRRPELPSLQPRTTVSRVPCSLPSFVRTYRAIWTLSSSLWGQASPRLPRLQVLQTPPPENKNESGTHTLVLKVQRRTDPWEDDIAWLCHRSFPAVDVHHRLLHQHVVKFPPVWPASSYCCSAGEGIH